MDAENAVADSVRRARQHHPPALQEDLPFLGPVDAAQDVHQGRLAGAVLAHKAERRSGMGLGIRFLLNDDNYFSAMRNMWVDLRSNLAASRDFSLRRLPDLHAKVLANTARPVSDYVVTLNIP